ncbi:ribosomal-processing cysteine protease Prp [Spiroplasma endosymbiont of Aspidapion aeneum]|uniref:ribosomal-processing cysteine protease Prp n=1 Tax=Spiroplasma endosymbiont of Aspidapion aeneum TaxID=3066276 RepID=UPI00313EF089
MIKIEFIKKNNYYQELKINGHALFDEHGKDIVCAGISSIIFGGLNAFDILIKDAKININNKDNEIEIYINKPNDSSDLLFNFLNIQLKTIRDSYPKHIEIKGV